MENKSTLFQNVVTVVVGVAVLFLVLTVLGFDGFVFSATELTDVGQARDFFTPILGAGVLLAVISLGTEKSTELLKILLRFLFSKSKYLTNLQPNGVGSLVLALIVSFAGIKGFDVSIFDNIEIFKSLDPELVSIVTIALNWVLSSVWHNKLTEGEQVGKAQPVQHG